MKIVQINRSDGGITILRVIDDSANIEAEIDKWLETYPGVTVSSYQEISEADIPDNRINREAWTWQ